MPFTNNNGVRLHWDEAGSGTPILLVMGHLYSAKMWYPILSALTAAHRVIWFDNRGTGESDTTGGVTVGKMADDAIAVMNAAGVDRAHIFGVSMGGVIVEDVALRYPGRIRSLTVGCAGILSAEKPRAPAVMRALYYLPTGLLMRLLSSRRGDHGYGSAASPDAVVFDQAAIAKEKFTKRGVAAQSKALANYRITKEEIARLTVPTLVLHGDEDALVPFSYGEELVATVPNSRLVRFRGAGHNFMVVDKDLAARSILDFVREVEQGT